MNGHLGFDILDTVYRKIYIPKSLIVSSIFLLLPFFKSSHQKTLDKPGPLAYKKEVILDTVYTISNEK